MSSALTAFRRSSVVVIFITSFWLSIVFSYYVPMLLLLPLALVPKVGVKAYRLIIGWYDVYWGRWACLSVPFSHCRTRLFIEKNGFDLLDERKGWGDGLMLSTHCSRIDWLFGVYIGMVPKHQARIGFVAEVTTALMPIIGWSRYLLGDILLQRAFHKDKPRILDNIKEHHDSGVKRLIFLAPEGTIADPGIDEAYVADCRDFMLKLNKKPLTHCLTPRYKGMESFLEHAPTNVMSCVMCFVTGPEACEVDASTGAALGGRLCNLSLEDPKRFIPDLHTLFEGDFSIFTSIHVTKISRGDPAQIKEQLIADQVIKDDILRTFDKSRKFKGMKSGDDWVRVPAMHVKMNLILIAHLFLTMKSIAWAFGVSDIAALWKMAYFVLFTFVFHGTSYSIGMRATDNTSRESLVGETAIKALLRLITGRDMNRGGQDESKKSK